MTDILSFVLARYNYWIVIVLMMTGLYIVFSRGNLVKTVVGLNIFQTSVFIFYITLGKVAGGTAPILIGGHGEAEGHGDEHGVSVRDPAGFEYERFKDGYVCWFDAHTPCRPSTAEERAFIEEVFSKADAVEQLNQADALAYASGERANEIGDLAAADLPSTPNAEGLHDAPVPSNALTPGNAVPEGPVPNLEQQPEITRIGPFETYGEGEVPPGLLRHPGDGHYAADAALDAVIYSNPLPHVLILTAIVVGVATTAVGLAIAVRIREAYGTVEEDALERMDNEASGYPEGQPTA